MAASSVLSSSGVSASSRFSLASRACSLSRWLLTDTYSPSAIDTAPATRPAIPAVRIAPRADVAPATPTTIPATGRSRHWHPEPQHAASSASPLGPPSVVHPSGSPSPRQPPRPAYVPAWADHWNSCSHPCLLYT